MKNIYLFILFITLSSIAFCVDVPAQKSIEEIAVKLTTADGVTDRASLETFLNNKRGGNLNAEFPVNATQYPSSIVPDHCIFSGYFMPLADGMHIASFSDDGVTIKTKEVSKMIEGVEMPSDPNINWEVKVPMYGQGIPLPDLSKSLQDVGNGWVKNTKYQIEVEYSNVSHPDYTDIDGATLFFYGSDVSFTKMPVVSSLGISFNKSNIYNYMYNDDTHATVTLEITADDSNSDTGCKDWTVTINPPANMPNMYPMTVPFSYEKGKTLYIADYLYLAMPTEPGTFVYTATVTDGSITLNEYAQITIIGANVTASTTDNLLLLGETFNYTMSIPNPTSIVINNNGDTYTNQPAKVTIIGDLYEYDTNGILKIKQEGAFTYGLFNTGDSVSYNIVIDDINPENSLDFNQINSSLSRTFHLKINNPGIYNFKSKIDISINENGNQHILYFNSNNNINTKIVNFDTLPDLEIDDINVDENISINSTFYPPLTSEEKSLFTIVSVEETSGSNLLDHIFTLLNNCWYWVAPTDNTTTVVNTISSSSSINTKKTPQNIIVTSPASTKSNKLYSVKKKNSIMRSLVISDNAYLGRTIQITKDFANTIVKTETTDDRNTGIQTIGVETATINLPDDFVSYTGGVIKSTFTNKWYTKAKFAGFFFDDINPMKLYFQRYPSIQTLEFQYNLKNKSFTLNSINFSDNFKEQIIDLPNVPNNTSNNYRVITNVIMKKVVDIFGGEEHFYSSTDATLDQSANKISWDSENNKIVRKINLLDTGSFDDIGYKKVVYNGVPSPFVKFNNVSASDLPTTFTLTKSHLTESTTTNTFSWNNTIMAAFGISKSGGDVIKSNYGLNFNSTATYNVSTSYSTKKSEYYTITKTYDGVIWGRDGKMIEKKSFVSLYNRFVIRANHMKKLEYNYNGGNTEQLFDILTTYLQIIPYYYNPPGHSDRDISLPGYDGYEE